MQAVLLCATSLSTLPLSRPRPFFFSHVPVTTCPPTIKQLAPHSRPHTLPSLAMQVAIAVVDAHGAVIVLKRMTGCAPGSFDKFALAKARTASSLLMSSREFCEKYGPSLYTPRSHRFLRSNPPSFPSNSPL